MNLDNELRAALRRQAPPPDFAAKVLAKTSAALPFPKPPKSRLQRPVTLAIAAAVMAMAVIPAVVVEYQRREDAKGMKAKQDLMIALAITKNQLQQTKEMIRRTTRSTQ